MSQWKTITPEEFQQNTFKAIGKDWMLVTAAKDGKVNTMTASWGGLGVMWAKNVAFVVIRPQRYTKQFIDASDTLSLSFYSEEYRKMLSYMGSHSGKDTNKIKDCSLTVAFEHDTPYFEEAEIVFLTKKLYVQSFDSQCFLSPELDEKWYAAKDYHDMYICEIEKILVKES